mgnify:CR=1 FL=1
MIKRSREGNLLCASAVAVAVAIEAALANGAAAVIGVGAVSGMAEEVSMGVVS